MFVSAASLLTATRKSCSTISISIKSKRLMTAIPDAAYYSHIFLSSAPFGFNTFEFQTSLLTTIGTMKLNINDERIVVIYRLDIS